MQNITMEYPTLLHHLVDHAAARAPKDPALVRRDRTISYRALATMQNGFAGALARTIAPGERVAIWAPKSPEMVAAAFGTTKAGCAFVPINPVLKPRQAGHILADCTVSALVTTADRLLLLDGVAKPGLIILLPGGDIAPGTVAWDVFVNGPAASLPRFSADDVAAILYTSGSTGLPKGVVVPHRSLVTGAQAVAAYLDQRADDRLLAVLPLSFDAGFSQLTTAFLTGASCILLDYAHPAEVVRTMTRERITGITAVPPLWSQLADLDWSDEATAHLRYFATTGGRMPRPLLDRLRRRAPGARPYLMYGLTEAFRSTYLAPADIDRKPGSIGKAIPGQRVRILRADGTACRAGETGEIVHSGSTVALGYWNDPQATDARFRDIAHPSGGVTLSERTVFSGDQGRMDEEGYLYFVGREDEMIKSSGYRISPVEIEEAAHATGLVAEAAAFGVEDAALGQRVVLAIVEREGADVDDAALGCALRQLLPNYMMPSGFVRFEGPLPRNPNGKIDRSAVAAHADAQA